jgi:hypothetical protein
MGTKSDRYKTGKGLVLVCKETRRPPGRNLDFFEEIWCQLWMHGGVIFKALRFRTIGFNFVGLLFGLLGLRPWFGLREHTCSEISYRTTDVECIERAQTPQLNLTGIGE